MKDYADILASVPGVAAWIVRRTHVTEHQRYLLKDRPECERTVERTNLRVTVFNRHDRGQGQASFTLFGKEPLERSRVEDAVFMASLQANPAYGLPSPAPLPAVELRDPKLRNLRSALDGIQDQVYAAAGKEKGVRLSSAEAYLDLAETEILTSAGVEAAKEETSVFLDLVVLARDGDRESESHGEYEERRLSSLKVGEIVARHATFARDTLKAELPATHRGPVVVSNGAFIPFFTPFRFATSGRSIYRKLSPLALGKPALGDRQLTGDPFTLASDATLAYGDESTPFDEQGLALAPARIINAGMFEAAAADQQYAEYLGMRATGDWHNVVLSPGSATVDELLEPGDDPVIHVVEFSFLNPENVSGGFSTEIRLGYEIGKRGTRVIKGGSLVGNVYDAFAAARYSRDTELRGDYFGPPAIRFASLQVTGKS